MRVRLPRRLRQEAIALRPLRRGRRRVLWTASAAFGFTPTFGFGNLLYLCLFAHLRQQRGQQVFVLAPPRLRPWFAVLPHLEQRLCVARDQVAVWDRREPVPPWGGARFGTDFQREQLQAFVRDFLVDSPLTRGARPDPHAVTVNVRRGNYFSVPTFRATYSFDIAGYLDIALGLAADRGGPIDRIHVVSDDAGWCRQELDAVLRCHADTVTHVAPTDSPQDHFRAVATATRIVTTNSTFSYWAGYVSNVLYGEGSQVVAPRFHGRGMCGGRAFQLDDTWSIVEEVPGSDLTW